MRFTPVAAVLLSLAAAGDLRPDERSDVVASLRWDVGGDTIEPLSVTVTKAEVGDSLCVQPRGAISCLFRLGEGQHFLGAFPTRDAGGVLMVFWVTGSAYRLLGLWYEDGRISTVLDVGAKQMPEFVWVPQQTEPAVIVARPQGALANPAAGGEAEIYLWTKGRYERQPRVPWDRRFQRGAVAP